MSGITLLSENHLPHLTGNHAVLEAAHSPAQCSKLIYRQHKYSADMIIQAKVNDWKCIHHATTVTLYTRPRGDRQN